MKDVKDMVVASFLIGLGAIAIISMLWLFAIFAGALSFYLVKSGKALVSTRNWLGALFASAYASAGICGSFVLASIALELTWPSGMLETGGEGLAGLAYFADKWIMADANEFFIRLIPICYFTNRVYLVRQNGGGAWLGVFPPLFAMFVFSVAIHYEEIARLADREVLLAIWSRSVEALWQPYDLVMLAIKSPNALVAWVNRELVATWPNLFSMAHVFPTVFFFYAFAFLTRTAFSPVSS